MASLLDALKTYAKRVGEGVTTFAKSAAETTGIPKYVNVARAAANTIGSEIARGAGNYQAAEDLAKKAIALREKTGTMGSFDQGVKSGLKTVGSGLESAVRTGLTVAGAPAMATRAGLTTMGTSALLGGGISKLTGGSFSQGAGSAVGASPAISKFATLTNPYIARALKGLPISGELSRRAASGVANVGQGVAMDASMGRGVTPLGVGIDFATGVVGGPSQFDSTMSMSRVRRKMHPEDVRWADDSLSALRDKKTTPEDRKEAIKILDRLAEKNLTKAEIDRLKGDPIRIGRALQKLAGDTIGTGKGPFGFVSESEANRNVKFRTINDGGVIKEVEGRPIKLVNGVETFIHQGDNPKRYNKGFVVSEKSTGRYLAVGETAREAIVNAKKVINDVGEDEFRQTISRLQLSSSKVPRANQVVNPSASSEVTQSTKGVEGEGVRVDVNKAKNLISKAYDKDLPNKDPFYVQSLVRDLRDMESSIIRNGGFDNASLSKQGFAQKNISDAINHVDKVRSLSPSKGVGTKVAPPAETTRSLPWERPGQTADTSLEGIQASRQAQTPETGGKAQPQPKIKLQTAPLKVSSTESITPPKAEEIKKTSRAVGKVNLLDWFRTPDRVLKKIGLGKEAEFLRTKYNDYLDELPKNIDRITGWYEQVRDIPDASARLFRYLDGQKVDLSPAELKVAGEMQAYLKEWADRLDLPYDKRIASYITHIFEKDFIQKDFDEDLAKIISEKLPGSVYDPFLQRRLGKQGYVEDVFRALDAYTKRATRKVHIDEALGKIQKAEYKLDLDSWKYVKSYTDRINLRPQQIDNYLDNLVKQSPVGYKLGQRPTAAISRGLRRTVYRGTLGLNVGSAVRNLTQGVNTYAKLGEKYTAIGYMKGLREAVNGGDELARVGVLRDNVVQDRQLSAVKGFMEKLDRGLFSLFDLAEKINRGSAYFGAKAKFLDQGLSEQQAIKKAVDLVRDTQFTFGSVDTPLALQGDIAKFLTQFQSFNVRQTEFLAEMAKGKEFGGLIRWLGANLAVIAVAGEVIGLDFKDIIPFYNNITGESKLGETPPIKLAKGVIQAVNKSPDEYGNVPKGNLIQRLAENKNVTGSLPAFIPAGVQAKKTIEGIGAYKQGASTSKSGRVRYPIEPGAGNAVRSVLFGQYNTPGARDYFDQGKTPLGETQSKEFMSLPANQKKAYYDTVMAQREREASEDSLYESIGKGDYSQIGKAQPRVAAEAVKRVLDKADKADRVKVYNSLKGQLPEGVRTELATILKMEKQGYSKKDRELVLVPEEIRARAVYERLMDLDKKNRKDKYLELVKLGVITPSMKPLIARFLKEGK